MTDVSQSDTLQKCFDRFANNSDPFTDQEKLSLCYKYYTQSNLNAAKVLSSNVSPLATMTPGEYIQFLIDRFTAEARAPQGKRVRKEYRMMTNEERDNYHRAIVMLRQDTVSISKQSFLQL